MATFAPNQKLWHPAFGYVKFVRELKATSDASYVMHKGKWEQVRTTDLLTQKPPKPTKKERFRNDVNTLAKCSLNYWVAGWIAAHETRFNVSRPPKEEDIVTDMLMEYGIDVDDATMTLSNDTSHSWSCCVSTNVFPDTDKYQQVTGVTVNEYYGDASRVQLKQREFVIGFLGGELKFHFNGEWRKRTDEELALIRSRIPTEYKADFEAGFTA